MLDTLFSKLPCSLFLPDIILSKNTRYKFCGKFKKLERLIHSTNSQWWDKYFLTKYLENRISPRGLRIQKKNANFWNLVMSGNGAVWQNSAPLNGFIFW